MTNTQVGRSGSAIWAFGAAAWLLGPIALYVSSTLEQSRPWEGLPLVTYLVGSAFFGLGGAALLLAVFTSPDERRFTTGSWIGVGAIGLALLASVFATWAIPIWAVLHGAGLLLASGAGRFRLIGRWIGLSFLAAVGVMIVLTELRVGTPDEYGDYPIAWAAAYAIVGLGAASGLALWSKTNRDSAAFIPTASAV